MNHMMTLFDEYYDMLKSGAKTIEYRLFDEKRKTIKKGDLIAFRKTSDQNAVIWVRVVELKVYQNLLEMYQETFEQDFKDRYASPQAVVDATTYYSEEDRKSHLAVAIHFERLR